MFRTRFGFVVLVLVSALVVIGLFLLVLGIGRTDVTSTLEFEADENTPAFAEDLARKVVARGEATGGECETYPRGTLCRYSETNAAHETSVGTGIDQNGGAYIRIHTSSTFWLPKGAQDVLNGQYLPDVHLEWEAWLRELSQGMLMTTRTRKLTGSDKTLAS